MATSGSVFECLVPSWKICLGRIRRCSPVEDVSLGVGFEVSKVQPFGYLSVLLSQM